MTSAPMVASHWAICGPLMIQLKSATRIPSRGSRGMAVLRLDYAGGAQGLLIFRGVEEARENRGVVLAEKRGARGSDGRGGHLDEGARILEAAGDGMIDGDEGVAGAQMRMMGGLRDG